MLTDKEYRVKYMKEEKRIEVVLDTNVVVSGTFWSGASFKALEYINKGKAEMIISFEIIGEYDRILNSDGIIEKTDEYQKARLEVTHKILSQAKLVETKIKVDVVKEDPDDNKFFEAALAAKADYIISQDKKHVLKIKEYIGIKTISPEDFLKLIK